MPMIEGEEEFDRFLARSLAPPQRAPDDRFADRVRHRIMLDELLRSRRAKVVERLGVELLSLVALGCGLAAIGASSEIADSMRQVPHVALITIMLVFSLWVPLVAQPTRGGFSGI